MGRMTRSYMLDPGAYIGRAVLYLTMSIIFGIIYLGARQKTQEHVLDILFAIAWGEKSERRGNAEGVDMII